MRFPNHFHSWLRHSWKWLENRLTRDPKIVIHGNSCIILYIQHGLPNTVKSPENQGIWNHSQGYRLFNKLAIRAWMDCISNKEYREWCLLYVNFKFEDPSAVIPNVWLHESAKYQVIKLYYEGIYRDIMDSTAIFNALTRFGQWMVITKVFNARVPEYFDSKYQYMNVWL